MTDLSELKKAELLKLVEEAGLEADAKATKADLIALLEAVPEPAEETVEEVAEEVAEEPAPEGLMALDGAEFVMAAYKDTLKREADAGGLAHYKSCLDFGALSKQEIIDDMMASEEYKNL